MQLHFQTRQQKFMEHWDRTRLEKRIEVHINSCDAGQQQEYFQQRQNSQAQRIFRLSDPNLQIIYITSCEMHPETLHQFEKVFAENGVADFKQRLTILQIQSQFFARDIASHLLVYYTSSVLAQLKALLRKNLPYYLVPSEPAESYVPLLNFLDCPILQGDFKRHRELSTKCRAIDFIRECQVPTGASARVTSELQIVDTIIDQLPNGVQDWVLKIDDMRDATGLAVIKLEHSSELQTFHQYRTKSGDRDSLKKYLAHLLQTKLRIINEAFFPSYAHFMVNPLTQQAVQRRGALLEQVPAVRFDEIKTFAIVILIEPNGSVATLGTYDKISARPFVNFGYSYPQRAILKMNAANVAEMVGRKLFQ